MDPGESEIETAWRETREEAGFQRSHLRLMDGFENVLNYEVRGKQKRVVYWLAELIDPHTAVILSDEHRDFKWVKLPEALELTPWPDTKKLYQAAQEFLEKPEQS